ncbi:MAG TPA: molybdopterin-guanine dinucleotide biosynthesis protein B [Alphaproteobacteria bacterium]|jgi:molybdopterin-guanine dinucleotide biosynthesis protein B|nr:molybdopterin-guanine dinucleotide biosynthesis protein B [Alphaproteobacteria bacterium]
MLLGLAGWSGSGKTTLVSNLIPELKKINISVSSLKHAHEGFDVDKPGKDSYVHRQAGAKEVLISSNKRFALIHEYKNEEISLNSLIKKLSPVDLILIEGWKKENIKKIEVYRKEINKPLLTNNDKNIIAIATNDKSININNMTILDLNNYEQIAKFIYALIQKENK